MSDIRRLQARPLARTPRWILPVLLILAAASLLPAPAAAAKPDKMTRKEVKAATEKLPETYRVWLEEVDVLITNEEREVFLKLEKDYQRDAFIQRFWEVRDDMQDSSRNEFYDRWQVRVQEARERFGNLQDQRARIFLLNGPPTAHIVSRCGSLLWPLEVWYYRRSERLDFEFAVVFYRRWGVGNFVVWQPTDGLGALFADVSAGSMGAQSRNLSTINSGCPDGDRIAGAIAWVLNQGLGYQTIQARFDANPDGPKGEWIATFGAYSTDVPPEAVPLPAQLDVSFPGRYQSRTVLQGLIAVPPSGAGQAHLGDHRSYNFVLTGEILQGRRLFDSFRYKFDFPLSEAAEGADGGLPLVFQRYLRPGDYTLIVKVEDLNSKKLFRTESAVKVPEADNAVPPPAPSTPQEIESARLLAEANAAIGNGETTLKLIRPPGDLQTGMQRFDTLTTGSGVAKVTFALDGKPVLTKNKPPYSVELDMGSFPRTRTLTATGYDAKGGQIVQDEMLVNAPGHRFRVDLVEPRKGRRYESSLLARAETTAPEGETVDRVEFYLNEDLVATLYQAPYVQPIVLAKGNEITYVRTVAYLTDGNSTEDTIFVNAPEGLEELEIDFVELYTAVQDRNGRPIEGLDPKDFTVFEDGTRQEIARFEKVSNLPIHAAVALDVSASMEDNLDQARNAALQFLQHTIQPKDRAALITFNDRPHLAVKFTKDVTTLAGGLAGLKAERGTALYDTVIFSLYYFNGIKGQRALLLLSDGKDENSRFTYEEAVEYARRAGVTLYTIGLGEEVERKKLVKLAEETGGRGFFLKDIGELPAIYAAIEEELRSKYLIAYQSSNTGGENVFRAVEVKVGRPGADAKTIRGYYP